MGSRRLGRKRLFSLDKKGQTVDLAAGAGIKDAIVEATQKREGHQIITEIVLDLGTSKATIVDSGNGGEGASAPIGVHDTLSYITQMTEAKYGVITEIRAVLLETVAGGISDFDLEYADDTAGKPHTGGAGTRGANPVSILTAVSAVGEDTSAALDANATSDKYLYLCQGANSSGTPYTAGKLVIYIYGWVTPASI